MDALLAYELTGPQRVIFLWGFVVLGLLICFQIGQIFGKGPIQWTNITKESKPIWHAIYVLDAYCFVVSAYPLLKQKMEGKFNGYEEQLLDGIWMGLLCLETILVLGITMRTVSRKLKAPPKLKTT